MDPISLVSPPQFKWPDNTFQIIVLHQLHIMHMKYRKCAFNLMYLPSGIFEWCATLVDDPVVGGSVPHTSLCGGMHVNWPVLAM